MAKRTRKKFDRYWQTTKLTIYIMFLITAVLLWLFWNIWACRVRSFCYIVFGVAQWATFRIMLSQHHRHLNDQV